MPMRRARRAPVPRADCPVPHPDGLARAMTEPSKDEAGGNKVRAPLEPPTDTLSRCRGSVGNRAWTPSIRPGLIREEGMRSLTDGRLYKIAHQGSRQTR